MAEVKLRLNLDAEEVELVVDGQVALSSGKDILANWVSAINDKNKPVHVEPVVVETPVPAEPIAVEVPVNENVIETPSVETPTPVALEVPKED